MLAPFSFPPPRRSKCVASYLRSPESSGRSGTFQKECAALSSRQSLRPSRPTGQRYADTSPAPAQPRTFPSAAKRNRFYANRERKRSLLRAVVPTVNCRRCRSGSFESCLRMDLNAGRCCFREAAAGNCRSCALAGLVASESQFVFHSAGQLLNRVDLVDRVDRKCVFAGLIQFIF